ncbi:hypothetical protein GCM10009665_60060 [Kitasatospora nipponensis]|uniref:LysM domain-containing protein n=1 Tax=Kitasatospora nipponensis TaxID=258049 RepID=A0ABN1WV68_9ACTN
MTTNTANVTFYIVRPGDTLTGIAAIFGTTVEQLVTWNDIADPDLIKVGERLIVTWAQVSHESFYVVRSGDTLTSIAAMFGTTVEQLVEWNGIANPDVIDVGQRLVIATSVPMGH